MTEYVFTFCVVAASSIASGAACLLVGVHIGRTGSRPAHRPTPPARRRDQHQHPTVPFVLDHDLAPTVHGGHR